MKGIKMDFKEIISIKALHKFDSICLHNPKLHQDKELQQQILTWAADMLIEAREDWRNLHTTTIKAIVKEDRKMQAINRGKGRDRKYAPFRIYFKQIQKEQFENALKNGKNLTANYFAYWFLENKANDMVIPYEISNRLHKLIRLAEANNREFKTSIECKRG